MTEITTFSGETTQVDGESLADVAVNRLLAQVGARVRKARELKGIPRRVLSEMSGVSPRYLAQLEGGEGNISIGLLKRVAIALDQSLEGLVGAEDPWESDLLHLGDLFRAADQGTQEAVLRLLNHDATGMQRAQRLCLVGLRGAGKSTLGRMLGEAVGAPFVELNREIENHGGMPVDEIIALYGQEGYRKLEADALDRVVATYDRVVLAVAGGIVSETSTYNKLLSRFHTVWVKASPQEHMDRVRAQGGERPMAGNPEAMAQLKSILVNREALYDRAHAQLDTSAHAPDQSLQDLKALVEARQFLD